MRPYFRSDKEEALQIRKERATVWTLVGGVLSRAGGDAVALLIYGAPLPTAARLLFGVLLLVFAVLPIIYIAAVAADTCLTLESVIRTFLYRGSLHPLCSLQRVRAWTRTSPAHDRRSSELAVRIALAVHSLATAIDYGTIMRDLIDEL